MRNYPEEVSNIYKPYHNLAYTGEEMKNYAEISNYAKVNGDEASMQLVVAALRSVDEGKDIDAHVDVESVMKYMALQTMVVNFDCMTGHNTQNYYLHEANGKISLIPWDYNLAWGGYPDEDGDFGDGAPFDVPPGSDQFPMNGQFPFFGLPENPGVRSKEEVCKIVNFPIDTPFSGDLSKRQFFMKLLANEQYKARYYHYLNILCNQYILGGGFSKTLSKINGEVGKVAGTEAYEAMNADGQRVGGAIIVINHETRHNELAFLYVKVGVQGKGIGQAIWKAIEALHPETEVWETCTPYFDRRNIHFYINCCGFHAVEFFHAHHPDPHMPEQFDQEGGLFRFEKCK